MNEIEKNEITVNEIAVDRVNLNLVNAASVMMFLFLAGECARCMVDLNRAWHSSFLGLSVANDLFRLMETQLEVSDCENPVELNCKEKLPSIDLHKVCFAYPTGAQAVKGVDMHIPAGMTAAVVGRSGAGKSTLLNLLLRFYDPQSGSIEIDGKDLRKLSLDSLRKNISVVWQDSFLFCGSIAENIRMARPDATEAEMIEAAKAANAHDFIMALPDGYNTMVGERGMTLSGGERQRISIARAILKNAPILLLDEATSSVDAESEAMIQAALGRLMRSRTTIMIAHRLSTIQNADKIFVLDDGRFVESGSHSELLKKNGTYAELIAAQKEAVR